ncbi:sugar ABC transporter substrate-binding protein [Blautia sp. XA-2221]|uniref:sugar ABC transporter substrate-binding protein n=1 Tax=Blautia sp. XA-2221 TaxID=2903961 RepID=UPI002378D3D0|nr:substrate-binding domain-containing protein [Blautia sp. XA-2221]
MKKKRFQWKSLAILLVAVITLGGLYYYGVFVRKKEIPSVYSVILYQETEDEWGTLIQGIMQAEKDLKVDVNYIYLSENDTAEDQIKAVNKEIREKSSGILMAAVNSEGIQKAMEKMLISVPIIFVETGAGDSYPVIRSDDYAMGKALGEAVLQDMEQTGTSGKVTIITENMERDSVSLRYKGIKDTLEHADQNVLISSLSGDFSAGLFEQIPYLITLDKSTTERAAALWKESGQIRRKNGDICKIYGVGNTAQTVNALDNEDISLLVYQNEFNMGYQGLTCLVKNKKKEWIEKNTSIRYRTVTKESLYEDENERLLFSDI